MAELSDSPQGQFEEALIADLTALALEGIGENWHARRFPWVMATDTTPIGLVSQIQDRINRGEGMIGLNDIRYRWVVMMTDASNGELSAGRGTPMLWHNTVFNRYHRTTALRSYGVTGLMGTEVEAGVPSDAGIFKQNYDAQYLTINARFRLSPAQLPTP